MLHGPFQNLSHLRLARMPYAWLLALLCMLMPPVVLAQVNKCAIEGRTVFTDAPCLEAVPPNTAAAKNASQIGDVPDAQILWNRYPVKGKDYESLQRALLVSAPKGFHGLAGWNITYHYTTTADGKVCKFETVSLNVKGEILMPHWTDETAAPQELRQRWHTYHAALRQHEEGHVQIGKDLATLVREKFLSIGNFPCSKAQTIAQTEFDEIYKDVRERDKEYDERTLHGATQGARF
jgi:predicted secreted Zn-dependent protease